MFGGGDKTKVTADAQRYFCGGAFKPSFDPAKDGNAACKAQVASEIDGAYAQLPEAAQRDALDRYLQVWYGQPYFECLVTSGGAAQGINRTTGPKAMTCMADFYSGKSKLTISALNTSGQPSEFAVQNGYIPWAVSMIKQGVDPSFLRSMDAVSMPPDLGTYLDSIQDKHGGLVYSEAIRLYHEALEQFQINPPADLTAAINNAAGHIKKWAEETVALPEKPEVSADILATYVQNAAADKVDDFVKTVPGALLDGEALGFPVGSKPDLDGIAGLRRLFYDALMTFRRQGGTPENLDDIAKKTAAAVKEVITAKFAGTTIDTLGKNLLAYTAFSQMSGTTLDKVVLNPTKINFGDTPLVLIDALNARNNPMMAMALMDLWRQVKDYAAANSIDIAGKERALARSLAAQIAKGSSPKEIVLKQVTGIDKDKGTVTLEAVPAQIETRLIRTGFGIIDVYVKLRQLYAAAKKDPSKPKDLTDAALAEQVGIRAEQMLRFSNSDKLPLSLNPLDFTEPGIAWDDRPTALGTLMFAQWDGFGADGKAKPFKAGAAGSGALPEGAKDKLLPEWLTVTSDSTGIVTEDKGTIFSEMDVAFSFTDLFGVKGLHLDPTFNFILGYKMDPREPGYLYAQKQPRDAALLYLQDAKTKLGVTFGDGPTWHDIYGIGGLGQHPRGSALAGGGLGYTLSWLDQTMAASGSGSVNLEVQGGTLYDIGTNPNDEEQVVPNAPSLQISAGLNLMLWEAAKLKLSIPFIFRLNGEADGVDMPNELWMNPTLGFTVPVAGIGALGGYELYDLLDDPYRRHKFTLQIDRPIPVGKHTLSPTFDASWLFYADHAASTTVDNRFTFNTGPDQIDAAGEPGQDDYGVGLRWKAWNVLDIYPSFRLYRVKDGESGDMTTKPGGQLKAKFTF